MWCYENDQTGSLYNLLEVSYCFQVLWQLDIRQIPLIHVSGIDDLGQISAVHLKSDEN